MNEDSEKSPSECPICCKSFTADAIEAHVNRCIFLNSTNEDEKDRPNENKRTFSVFNKSNRSPTVENKKFKKLEPISKRAIIPSVAATVHISDDDDVVGVNAMPSTSAAMETGGTKKSTARTSTKSSGKSIPLAEKMRPESIDDYIGQSHVMGKNTLLRKILDKNETPSMILWGPPGVGKVNSYLASFRLNMKIRKFPFFIHHRQRWPISLPIEARQRKMCGL